MTILVPHEEIVVSENRQRQEFPEKHLLELVESIADKGLLHPIVLRNDGRTLVAGERRLRAIERLRQHNGTLYHNGALIPSPQVPCSLLGELTPFQVREAELEENVVRADLTWQERSRAVAELHQLRAEQKSAIGKTQTYTATAQEVFRALDVAAQGSQVKNVREDVQLAQHLDDPQIAKAKTRKEALKALERKRRLEHRETLAREFGGIVSEHTIHQGDTFQLISQLSEGKFGIVLTDPPYGIDATNFGTQAGARHEYQDSVEFAMKCYATTFASASRLCRESAALFAFCDIRLFNLLVDLACQAMPEWHVWETPLIWHKASGMLPVPDRGPRRTYESILYAYRGKRQWNTVGGPDLFSIPAVREPEFGAQKPPELYEALLRQVYEPGDRVLDPFAGTCPVIPACNALGLTATCIEKDEAKVHYAKITWFDPERKPAPEPAGESSSQISPYRQGG